MKINRKFYFVLTLLILILGVLSRKTNGIPLFFGDVLYAVLIYFGMCFLFLNLQPKINALLSLTFCFIIEYLQLCQMPWMLSLRKTTLGHYVLGQGFLWSDLLCYAIGVSIAIYIDKKIRTQNSSL
ncbi:DUF2809 domain-containing protein [Flavobacterium amnicola]|uniref:DUF2809 domain-containing protein n=1 Tax=Flavobacterium amnicola TaxID=2506422 RepID=A0A4Q1K0E8_9FLAO|nr:DUF2809 domain-containing protein [Flavobacterium amnicola]RXR17292.1 DUF2809 domain-containing protein [Flavobacterium amnicola]